MSAIAHTPQPTVAAELDPLDLYNVRSMLSDEERLVQDSVGKFVDEQVIPIIGECFEEERFPRELVPAVAELGLLGSSIHGYGCAGLNAVSYGLICQELERGDSGLRSFVSVQSSLCIYPIYAFGSEEQKQKWLPRMARGEVIGCFGLTEPHGGSDPANMKTVARRQGKDWVLSGAKMWITNGSIADLAIVWAKTDEGIRGFLVEKGFKGFTTNVIKHKMRLGRDGRGASVSRAGHRLQQVTRAVRQAAGRDAGGADPPRGDGAQDHDLATVVAAARSLEGCRSDGADAGVDGEMAQHAFRDRGGARRTRPARRRRHQRGVRADPPRAELGKRDHLRRHGNRAPANGRTRAHRHQRLLNAPPHERCARAAARRALRAVPKRPSRSRA
jgi:hypothetical protein